MMRPDQERVRKLLTEAVTLLCRNSLQFQEEVTVEGLIGITLDKKDIFLVSINESVENTSYKVSNKRQIEENVSVTPDSPNSKKRRHSHDKRRKSPEKCASPVNISPSIQPKIEPCDEIEINDTLDPVSIKIKTENVDLSSLNYNSTSCVSDDNSHNDRLHSTHNNNDSINRSGVSNTEDNTNLTNHSSSMRMGPDHSSMRMGPADINIKEETKEEEDSCFVIDSDEDYDDSFNDSLSTEQKNIHGNYVLGEGNVVPFHWGNNETNLEYLGSDSSCLDSSSEFQHANNLSHWQSLDNPSSNMLNDGSNSLLPGTSFNSSHDPNQRTLDLCPYCGRYFRRLSAHMRDVHHNIRKFTCDDCGMKFSKTSTLKRHHLRKHAVDAVLHSCERCQKQFKVIYDLRQHMKRCRYNGDLFQLSGLVPPVWNSLPPAPLSGPLSGENLYA